ncbi:hypothetical protein M8C21_015864 [Ambrosia artemisiifolia]|uniref:Protein kinase domain-containing protein n=1 Tax=Ambrosia artemisiifolia TaxID=4212 RepID=A0AAD5D1S0_AMBAR|nr:hypothetical protein M8C21_015864 [Ambrosia artemisiifolia]
MHRLSQRTTQPLTTLCTATRSSVAPPSLLTESIPLFRFDLDNHADVERGLTLFDCVFKLPSILNHLSAWRMESFIKEFEHLKIRLQDIKSATNNFDETKLIGSDGFGPVYKGNLSHSKGRSMVAVKRLDRKFGLGQGDSEFWKEILPLSRYNHENFISLLGFCIEDDEMILVHEYAANGSLDHYLNSTNLTWTERLKICVGVARGLSYLHDVNFTQDIVFHRDIKSSNILFDADWNAKVSISGLSKGTLAASQKRLARESDIYSLGVILFEILCGRLAFEHSDGLSQVIVPTWKESYKQNKLQEIILEDLKPQINRKSLETFSYIAYKCVQESYQERPNMRQIVKSLESALEFQELYEGVKPTPGYKQLLMITAEDPQNYRSERELTKDYKEILMITAEDPLNNIPETELKILLHKGILLNRGKTWFSLNMDGEHCEMISIADCLTLTTHESPHYIRPNDYISRFAVGCYEPFGANFKTHVRTQFLSTKITYTVNLVFKNKSKSRYIGLKYKLKGELSNSYSFLSDEREDGWLTAELYQFTSDQRTVDLEIWFYTECCPTLLVEGIEFRPLKKVKHEVIMDDKVDMQPLLDRETYWEQKLPIDYEDIIKRSKDIEQWKTKKELYSILCKGFLISYGEEWFYLAKDGKKCLMLPARAALEEDKWEWKHEPETRFEEVADCIFDTFVVFCKFSSKMLSPQTTYAAFLVYELPDDCESVDQPPPVQVVDEDLDSDSDSDSDSKEVYNIFLRTPQTPVISWNEKEEKTFKPLSRLIIKGLPKQRRDGWMEVQVHEFQTHTAIKMVSLCLKFSSNDMSLKGVIVLGLEFRPI